MRLSEIAKKYDRSIEFDPTLSADQIIDQYAKEIELALIQYRNKNVIYRGTPKSIDVYLVDPTTVERVAANTSNYTNLLVSNLPSWQQYPKRNRSLICTTSYTIANAYGGTGTYVVLPFGNPTIGICPSLDFWDGFNDPQPPELNSEINQLLKEVGMISRGEALRYGESLSFQQLIGIFNEIDSMIGLDILAFLSNKLPSDKMEIIRQKLAADPESGNLLYKASQLQNFRSILNKGNFTTPTIELIVNHLDPNLNNFRFEELANFDVSQYNNNEVWISTKCLLIKPQILRKLLYI